MISNKGATKKIIIQYVIIRGIRIYWAKTKTKYWKRRENLQFEGMFPLHAFLPIEIHIQFSIEWKYERSIMEPAFEWDN